MKIEKIRKIVDEAIENILIDKIEKKDIAPEKRLVEDLGADSIQLLEIALTVSAETDLEVPREELIDLITVQDVYSFLSDRLP